MGAAQLTLFEEVRARRLCCKNGLRGVVNLLSDLFRSPSVCHIRPMHTSPANRYKNHRFPAEIIRHSVWLYYPLLPQLPRR
jgi:hypothetical protein